MDEIWIYVGSSDETLGVWYDEYVNAECTLCKQVWNDGYEEVYEIAK